MLFIQLFNLFIEISVQSLEHFFMVIFQILNFLGVLITNFLKGIFSFSITR